MNGEALKQMAGSDKIPVLSPYLREHLLKVN